ncbi:PAS domain-containing protein [Nisaea denitrificans]|uniref:PAS domain-containing protein n=1 Tax=Nisaea denitrificans TaxID=390877 RepID=UPI00040E3C56|nr:PAS domain-containing protein [Nisaea denitrificans]
MDNDFRGNWDTELALENPRLQEFFSYWQQKARPEGLPARSDFDPVEMKGFLGHLFLVVPEPEIDDFRYTLIGTTITSQVGIDNTGRTVGEVFGAPGLKLYRKVRDERAPIRVHGTVEWRRKEFLAYESVLLPLADDAQSVDHFVGMMVFGPAAS